MADFHFLQAIPTVFFDIAVT